MKKHYLLLSSLALCLNVYSQQFSEMFDTTLTFTWSMWGPAPSGGSVHCYNMKVDSIIIQGGIISAKVDHGFDNKVSYLLQDSTGKIYLGDTLLYDFSLNIGDTAWISGMSDTSYYYITDEDSVVIGNVMKRRLYVEAHHIGLWASAVSSIWIEGYGSSIGPLSYFMPFVGFSASLNAISQSGNILYKVNNSCDFISGIESTVSKFSFTNNNEFIAINGFIEMNISADIYSYNGALIKEVNASNLKKIDISDLEHGMYILQLRTGHTILQNYKFVKY